jgi:radical SAM protein with 4Fe4S-binding SPASM domain
MKKKIKIKEFKKFISKDPNPTITFYGGEPLLKINKIEPCTKCEHFKICGGRCLYANHAKLWPKEGGTLICETVIHLIKELNKKCRKLKI